MRGNVENATNEAPTNEEKGGYGRNRDKLYGTEMKNSMVPMIGEIGRFNSGKASVIKQKIQELL